MFLKIVHLDTRNVYGIPKNFEYCLISYNNIITIPTQTFWKVASFIREMKTVSLYQIFSFKEGTWETNKEKHLGSESSDQQWNIFSMDLKQVS